MCQKTELRLEIMAKNVIMNPVCNNCNAELEIWTPWTNIQTQVHSDFLKKKNNIFRDINAVEK